MDSYVHLSRPGYQLCCTVLASETLLKMLNARRNIVKEKGAAPTEFEEEVAKALFDIEVSPSSDIKADLRDVTISKATEIDVKQRKAVIVHFPFRAGGMPV